MAQQKIKGITLLTLFLVGLILMGDFLGVGCSSANKGGIIDPDTGKHPANWYENHRPVAAASADFTQCSDCHGADLQGGISKVSCFSMSVNGLTCHGHPPNWTLPDNHGAAAKLEPDSIQNHGFSSCQTCHGAQFTGGRLSSQSCLTCHGGIVAPAPHSPADWRTGTRTHITTNALNAPECALCHLGNRTPPSYAPVPSGTTPGCFNSTLCHDTRAGVCGTCHALPPNGAIFPNTAGRHAVHAALVNVGADCTVCHTGAGPGNPTLHQNGISEVAFPATYNAESGLGSFNNAANTCSSVSCHGGQTTPNWLTGTINVNTQCTSCHISGTTQFNSYFSGEHNRHVNGEGFACTVCHDTTLLATNHFTTLNTSAMEGPASATIRAQLQYNGTTCNPSAGGLSGCHGSETW